MDVKYWQLDEEKLTEIINEAKDTLISRLKDDNIITNEQFENISKKYIMIVKKPNLLSRFFKSEKMYILACALSNETIAEILEKESVL